MLLDYMVYSKAEGILAFSSSFKHEQAAIWRKLVSIDPMQAALFHDEDIDKSYAVGIFKGAAQDFILAKAYNYTENNPLYQYIQLPADLLTAAAGNIRYLIEMTEKPLPVTVQAEPLEPLHVGKPTPLSKRLTLLMDAPVAEFETLLWLLGAALDDKPLLICGFATDIEMRLRLIETLMVLLPPAARPMLTFCTHVENPAQMRVRIIFSENIPADFNGWVWSDGRDLDERAQVPYVDFLWERWQRDHDIEALSAELDHIDQDALLVQAETGEGDLIMATLERHLLNKKVLKGDEVSIAQLKAVLVAAELPLDKLHLRYTQRLLGYCLHEHDVESVEILGRCMAADAVVRQTIYDGLNALINDEPDAVYFFLRTLMGENATPELVPMLHTAARLSLKVAISDGDNETLMTWFRLIAREPGTYDLGHILREGIIAAQPRTHDDGELGRRLLQFAARRAPDMVDTLLDDGQFMDMLEAPLGPVLHDYALDDIDTALEISKEIALVIFGRAVQALPEDERAIAVFSDSRISQLWGLYRAGQFGYMPPHYQPDYLIDVMINQHMPLFSTTAVIRMLTEVLESVKDEEYRLFRHTSTQLSDKTLLAQFLVQIAKSVPPERVIMLTGYLVEDRTMTHQQAVDLYLQTVAAYAWQIDHYPFVEQAARLIHKHADLTVSIDVLWQMLQMTADARIESTGKVISRRVLGYIATLKDEKELTDALLRLEQMLQWSASLRGYILNWGREFIHKQPLARLQQLDKALDGKKALSDIRAAVQTTVAMRKMFGRTSLDSFSEAVATAYTLLQAFSDSFDPVSKQTLRFDPFSVRAEVDALQSQLTPEEQSVLAKNLKELAQLVIMMSEQRSKSSLMRREEEIDRQLLAGEQQPQSAIDTMKWLSGYLNGNQDDDE